jgi:NDP-sugar pyrophosphorylase family protein
MSSNLPETMHSALFFDSIPELLRPYFPDGQPLWEPLDRISGIIADIVRRSPGVFKEIQKGVFAGEGTVIAPNAVILGPALIGSGCEIRSGAFLRENVIIGNNCVIGNSTEIKNAILFNNVEAPHFNYIGDSIAGNFAHLAAGVIISNVRLDKQKVSVKWRNEKVVTNRMKFGAIIGDHAEIGCNSVINPGTLLEKNVVVFPLVNAGGHHRAGECIKRR